MREARVTAEELVHLVAPEGVGFRFPAPVDGEHAAPGGQLLLEAPKRREHGLL